jgi:hypothetical protein
MQAADKPAFQALLSDAMAFYRQDVSKFALSVWWQACQRFGLDQVTKAMTAHAMDPERGMFAPKPADIVRQLHGTHGDRALMAWAKVHEAFGYVGAYKSVAFDDPAIHAAIDDMGGWPAVARSTVDELPFTQRRFCDTYRAYSIRPGFAYPPSLPGEYELQNRVDGRPVALPMLVGDTARCAAVMSGGAQGARAQITSAADVLRLPQ